MKYCNLIIFLYVSKIYTTLLFFPWLWCLNHFSIMLVCVFCFPHFTMCWHFCWRWNSSWLFVKVNENRNDAHKYWGMGFVAISWLLSTMFDANMDHVHVLYSPFRPYNDSFRPLTFFRSFVHSFICSFAFPNSHTPTTRRKLMQSYLFDIGSDYSSLANVIYCVILFDVYCKIAFLMPFGTFCVVVQLRIFSANLSQFRESDF